MSLKPSSPNYDDKRAILVSPPHLQRTAASLTQPIADPPVRFRAARRLIRVPPIQVALIDVYIDVTKATEVMPG